MAINNILPFAQGGSALIQTQAVFTADSERTIGNQPGIARPDFVNKQIRQVTSMAVGLAQFLADNQGTNVDDTLLGAALSTMMTNAIKSLTLMPAGSIIWVPTITAPVGTLKLSGALLSRATYARLWAFAQASGAISGTDASWAAGAEYGRFSPGDGSTTFRIPDLRGYGLRCWDDARGIDSGRLIGTSQVDQNVSHVHGVSDPGHVHGYTDPGHSHSMNNPPHTHVITDPGHGHGLTDPGHAHTYSDPWHTHGMNDPSHAHSATVEKSNESGNATPWGSGGGTDEGPFGFNTDAALTGVTAQASPTGIVIAAQPTGIGLLPSGTGIQINNATTSVSVNPTFTGITIAAVATGLTVGAAGGNEVRVKNIALMPVMFY